MASDTMKVGVVGAGAVGAACMMALVARCVAREIVLVNRTRSRAKGVATDLRYGTPLAPRVEVRDGDWSDLAGAGVVLVTVGINEKAGGATDRNDPAGRLRLLRENANIYRDVIPRIAAVAAGAVLLVITDPPDPLADLARQLAGHDRVLSTGTLLDSLRFRVQLADSLGVDPSAVEAQVLGEHGTSSVFVWSGARVAGVPVMDSFARRGDDCDERRRSIEKEVRYANITIIEGIGASQYGIALVAARLAEMVLRDERAVVPVGTYRADRGVTLSLPTVVGREGGLRVFMPPLSPDEEEGLKRSAETLAKALHDL